MMIAELIFLAHTLFPHHHHDFEESILIQEGQISKETLDFSKFNLCTNHDHQHDHNSANKNKSNSPNDCHISDLDIVLNNHDNSIELNNSPQNHIIPNIFVFDIEGVFANYIKLETNNKCTDNKDDILLENNSLRAPPIC
jgi:hypothetical protein